MTIKAISFDYWNTLFTEPPEGFRFYNDRRREVLFKALEGTGTYDEAILDRACRLEAESHYQVWREEHRTLPVPERVGIILGHLEACLPDPVVAELVKAYEEGILEKPPVLIRGVRETLARLAGRYRMGIISDVGFSPGRVLKEVLEQAGIVNLFDSLVFSDEAGRSKPHRTVFEMTVDALGVRPGEIVHIGDLEHTDVIGARRAGFHSIRFTGVTPLEAGEASTADFVTDDFTRIPELIGGMS